MILSGLPHLLENTSGELFPNIPRTTKPHTRKNITMKRIPTSKPCGLPRFIYALIVCAPLFATLGVSSGIAADKNAKITLVYEHALPNVPGKSIKGVLVEYGPGGSSPAHTHPKSAFIYATVLEGAIRSSVNDGPVVTYHTGQSFSEMPGDRHSVSENASKTEPARVFAISCLSGDLRKILFSAGLSAVGFNEAGSILTE
jgi:quercetin dioxygenase-like cupin family protein